VRPTVVLVPREDRLVRDLDAFFGEHRRCGELDGGVEGERVWMTCTCGARMVRLTTAGLLRMVVAT